MLYEVITIVPDVAAIRQIINKLISIHYYLPDIFKRSKLTCAVCLRQDVARCCCFHRAGNYFYSQGIGSQLIQQSVLAASYNFV